jgi:anti-anti-sigma regulatory factor
LDAGLAVFSQVRHMKLFSGKKPSRQVLGAAPLAQFVVEESVEGCDRVLRLRGFADIRCIPTLQGLFRQYREENIRLLIFDLSATEFINSPVWATITLYACQNRHRPIVAIVGMPERIRGSFEMMGLYEELPAFATTELARQQLTSISND